MATVPTRQFTSGLGGPFTIRSARPDDAADLIAYIKAVAQESEFLIIQSDECPHTEDEERQWVQARLDGPGKIILVAEASGNVIGVLDFDNGSRKRISHRGTLGMTVRKDWRGRGVGTALLQCFIHWAEANPLIEKVGLGVFSTNEVAIRLYRKFGFIDEGRQPKEVKLGPDEYVDVILMYRFCDSDKARNYQESRRDD
jgi:RimJ/RimL family protein N-acetyltransferase